MQNVANIINFLVLMLKIS